MLVVAAVAKPRTSAINNVVRCVDPNALQIAALLTIQPVNQLTVRYANSGRFCSVLSALPEQVPLHVLSYTDSLN